jgi:hypothetical protein
MMVRPPLEIIGGLFIAQNPLILVINSGENRELAMNQMNGPTNEPTKDITSNANK